MAEDKFEQAVIDKIKSEGWEYLTDYSGVTVDRLYAPMLLVYRTDFVLPCKLIA